MLVGTFGLGSVGGGDFL